MLDLKPVLCTECLLNKLWLNELMDHPQVLEKCIKGQSYNTSRLMRQKVFCGLVYIVNLKENFQPYRSQCTRVGILKIYSQILIQYFLIIQRGNLSNSKIIQRGIPKKTEWFWHNAKKKKKKSITSGFNSVCNNNILTKHK